LSVIGGLEKAVITADVSAAIAHQHLDNPTILAGVTAVLSNLVSTFRPCFFSSHSFRICRIRNALGL